MKCPKCNMEMELGLAINYDDPANSICTGFGGKKVLTSETLKLIDCAKCPQCGYSDDLDQWTPSGRKQCDF